ncbi:MAG: NAD(P)H-hydrate epimerase [Blautia caecimuris]
MKQLDAYTIEKRGIPSCVLMERAALKTVEEMEKVFHKNNTEEKILCVCGSGNNGGDGIAIAGSFSAFMLIASGRGFMWQEIIPLLPSETARQLSVANQIQCVGLSCE